MTNAELTDALDQLRNLMIAVSTGGPRIDSVNPQYRQTYSLVIEELSDRGIPNPLQYSDLWQWYGRWSSGDLPSYQSRRVFVADLFDPLISRIRTGAFQTPQPTGWARVDRNVGEIRDRLASAATEEQFQAVGLLCREALISVGQEVFDPTRHPTSDGVTVSVTDFKRMIEAFIRVELGGSANEEARKHARSALNLAVKLQHQRTASFRDAAVCVEATSSVINIIAIVSGRRDPR